MSPLGQVGNGRRRSQCTDAEREFTAALVAVHKLFGLRQSEVAALIHYSPAAVSQYLNLQRAVPMDFVEKLHSAAADHVGGAEQLPIRREELLDLWEEAGRDGWSRQNGRIGRQRMRASALPGAAVEGDRQGGSPEGLAWDGLDDVRLLLESGHDDAAALLLSHVGAALSAEEVRLAAAACRSLGFADGAEALLRSASRRSPEALIEVVTELTRAGQHGDVVVLLLADAADRQTDVSAADRVVEPTITESSTEASEMSEERAVADGRLESADADSDCAGPAGNGDRRNVGVPRQRVAHAECGATPVGRNVDTGELECPRCGAVGEAGLSLCGESFEDEPDPERCPWYAEHIRCSECGAVWLAD